MKRQVILSVLVAIAIFAITSTSQAGMFGRLHVIRGCAPCEPVAACEPVACEPCEPACNPCGGDVCGYRPVRPFAGFFQNLKAKLAAHHCAPACEPCEAVEACSPCESTCEPVGCYTPFRPFGGFFLHLKEKLAAHHFGSCNPCEEVGCQPCEPAACDRCN